MTHIWRQRMPTWLQMSQADPRDDELLMPMCGGKNMHVLWSAIYSTRVFWWVKCQQFPARSRYPACLSSLLTYISTFHFALWWVEDKVLCAVGVLWPPAHAASWWSGAKKTCSSLYKTEKTSELCCHKCMKAFLRERSRRWEKLPRIDCFAILQTDSLCQPSKPTSKNGVWFLSLAAVPQCCASCNSTN